MITRNLIMTKSLIGCLVLGIGFSSCVTLCASTPVGENASAQEQPVEQVVNSNEIWGVRMAESIMYRHYRKVSRDPERETWWHWGYTSGLLHTAVQRLGNSSGDQRYHDFVQTFVDETIDENGNIVSRFSIDEYNIDNIKPGMILFDIYERTGEEKYLKVLQTMRRQLQHHPRTSEGGYWHKLRYPWQMWLDGIYMAAPFYARYGQVFNEPENFDDVIRQIVLIEEKTRDKKTGLLFHGWDESRVQQWADPVTGLSKSFWSRAIGWYAMALVDVLDYIPVEHPNRYKVIEVLQRTAEAVVKYQDPKTGVWYQVTDQMDREGNYLEASASAMFVYSLAKGARMGYLDKKYWDLANRAFDGIIEKFMTVDPDGQVQMNQICLVAGLGAGEHRDGTYEYYLSEPIVRNDLKGTGPFIMASLELNR
ncbi:MAG: glycoside hydrolase family 88 protein [Bacteroidales bacterium]